MYFAKAYGKSIRNAFELKTHSEYMSRLAVLGDMCEETYSKISHALQALKALHALSDKKPYKRVMKHLNEMLAHNNSRCNHVNCRIDYIPFKYGMDYHNIITKSTQMRVPVQNKWYLCSKCKLTYYCSRKCQKRDWITHKEWCI